MTQGRGETALKVRGELSSFQIFPLERPECGQKAGKFGHWFCLRGKRRLEGPLIYCLSLRGDREVSGADILTMDSGPEVGCRIVGGMIYEGIDGENCSAVYFVFWIGRGQVLNIMDYLAEDPEKRVCDGQG